MPNYALDPLYKLSQFFHTHLITEESKIWEDAVTAPVIGGAELWDQHCTHQLLPWSFLPAPLASPLPSKGQSAHAARSTL